MSILAALRGLRRLRRTLLQRLELLRAELTAMCEVQGARSPESLVSLRPHSPFVLGYRSPTYIVPSLSHSARVHSLAQRWIRGSLSRGQRRTRCWHKPSWTHFESARWRLQVSALQPCSPTAVADLQFDFPPSADAQRSHLAPRDGQFRWHGVVGTSLKRCRLVWPHSESKFAPRRCLTSASFGSLGRPSPCLAPR